MTEQVYFSWTCTALPVEVDAALQAIVAGCGGDPFDRSIELRAEDPNVSRVQQILEDAGTTPKTPGTKRTPHNYNTSRSRRWEPRDLDSAEFLWLQGIPPVVGSACSIFEDRGVRAPASTLRGKQREFIGKSSIVLCSDLVAGRLGSQAFNDLRFSPIMIVTGGADFKDWLAPVRHDTWWQGGSELRLPPMSPVIERWWPQGIKPPVQRPREERAFVILSDPPFRDLQPAYLKSDWQEVSPFDIAATYETTTNDRFGRMLIVSKRFYEFCMKEGLKADWVPVRFEEG